MSNKIDVSFFNEGKLISTRAFEVPIDGIVPLPADALFAFKNSELRIKATRQEETVEPTAEAETH